MRIIVAPDSFKGSLSATSVANAMALGIHSVFPNATIIEAPIADGGEGTVEALVTSTGGHYISEQVLDPLGNLIESKWGILGDGQTGVIEVAAASGLHLVDTKLRNPLVSTSYGTGQLIRAALDHGVSKLIIGLGGSATNDGGVGILQALGIRLLDKHGSELSAGAGSLIELDHIDVTGLHPRLLDVSILLASDVTNPLCGPNGASTVYGPQKGASPTMVTKLDQALAHYANIALQVSGRDIADMPGAGAAGGIGAGLMFFTDAELRPGIEFVLNEIHFDDMVQHANLVITGEGNTNYQTAFGKAPIGVAHIAARHNIPVICISGGLSEGYEDLFTAGIDAASSIVLSPMALEDCMANAPSLVQQATANVMRILRVGMSIKDLM